MTFEPLKNKMRVIPFFSYFDVKSAVNGLKHDIRTKDLEADNKEDAIKKMCNLVDKWFEDVI